MNSSALISGGALLFESVYFNISNSIFIGCTAKVGGAIRFFEKIPKMFDLNLIN